jgi:hypothetical protein
MNIEEILGLYRVVVKTGFLDSNMYIYQLKQKSLFIINPMIVNDEVMNLILHLGNPVVYLFDWISFLLVYCCVKC